MDTKNVTNVAVSYDSRENSSSYDIAFFKLLDLSVGDNVQIVFNPLGINVKTRIISLEYNPFYRYNIRVEVGSYRPSISDTFYRMESSITGVSSSVDNLQNQVHDLQVSYTIVKEPSIVDNTINVTYEVESVRAINIMLNIVLLPMAGQDYQYYPRRYILRAFIKRSSFAISMQQLRSYP